MRRNHARRLLPATVIFVATIENMKKQRAIQIFHTEDAGRHTTFVPQRKRSVLDPLIVQPNGRFRSCFDALTVAWVLFLMFVIPFEISFAWYKVGTVQKMFLVLLDIWLAFIMGLW